MCQRSQRLPLEKYGELVRNKKIAKEVCKVQGAWHKTTIFIDIYFWGGWYFCKFLPCSFQTYYI